MIEEPKVKLKRYLSHPVTVDEYIHLLDRQTDTHAHTIVRQKLELGENVLFWFLACLITALLSAALYFFCRKLASIFPTFLLEWWPLFWFHLLFYSLFL